MTSATRSDTMPQSIGSGPLIQTAGSNYSVDLSAATEAIVASIQYYPRDEASNLSSDIE